MFLCFCFVFKENTIYKNYISVSTVLIVLIFWVFTWVKEEHRLRKQEGSLQKNIYYYSISLDIKKTAVTWLGDYLISP